MTYKFALFIDYYVFLRKASLTSLLFISDQEIVVQLPAELWQQMAVQSPENTIYSASTQRSMERRKATLLDLLKVLK